jgi:hypothetical protein
MKRTLSLLSGLLAVALVSRALEAPINLVSRTGDTSVVLHWDFPGQPELNGFNVYRAVAKAGPFSLLNTADPVHSSGYCDLDANVINGRTNYYYVTAISTNSQESAPSTTLAAVPHPFATENEFLDYVQQVNFDYFWYLANPKNGLVPDRTMPKAACSIAAVGFGLTSIAIGIDHGWITREQGADRVLTTLNTFLNHSQGTNASGTIGYRGWFYHFLNMKNGTRAGAELSSIDTALLLAGMLDCKQYFNQTNTQEIAIRSAADAIFNRVDWRWMSRGTNTLSMGWFPDSDFIGSQWVGYNEAMILIILGLGAPNNPLPDSAWEAWCSRYKWATHYGQSYLPFAPLFGHQYSHCWIDFRHISDPFMRSHNITYFENSRRASLAQRAYCIANPLHHAGYSGTVWGLTACDGPPGYSAHGAPPAEGDDGTIAPTAAGASIVFTPEYSIPTLRAFYNNYRSQLWTSYGFRDGFNFGKHWAAQNELGIDQGPIVIMIENYRTQRVWRRFMENEIVLRGLKRAGFGPVELTTASQDQAPLSKTSH